LADVCLIFAFPGIGRADFSFHSLNNCHIGFFGGVKRKARRSTFGLSEESSANNWKLHEVNYFYHGFWLFARSEAIFFCFWWKCVAAGVGRVSTSVSDAGEGKPIVPGSAAVQEGAEFTGKPRDVTGKRRRGRKLTGKGRTAAATGGAKSMKKRWMIYLQRGCLRGL
jgi:hypothetical protein